ncbi:MAG TPA: hypothetical protein VF120_18155 [Ktedonobacterales bacterium]
MSDERDERLNEIPNEVLPNNEILPDMEDLAYTRPTADAGTSDDANDIGTTDNVRPADRFAPGGSGDVAGTIGNATGPLATPTPPAEGAAYPIAEDDPDHQGPGYTR